MYTLSGVQQCSLFGELGIRSWLALPPLFLCGTAGVAAALDRMLAESTSTALSVPLMFGCAAGLAVLSGGQVRWSRRWQRRVLRFGYPVVLLACAVSTDQVLVPLLPMLVVGAATLFVLAALLARRPGTRCGQD